MSHLQIVVIVVKISFLLERASLYNHSKKGLRLPFRVAPRTTTITHIKRRWILHRLGRVLNHKNARVLLPTRSRATAVGPVDLTPSGSATQATVARSMDERVEPQDTPIKPWAPMEIQPKMANNNNYSCTKVKKNNTTACMPQTDISQTQVII